VPYKIDPEVLATVAIAGQIDWYDLESDDVAPMTLRRSERTVTAPFTPARGTSSTAGGRS
jgi:hypothetical protein